MYFRGVASKTLSAHARVKIWVKSPQHKTVERFII
jgi:hypothetical protein